ncbi:MAG: ATP-binding protein [Thermoplasmata archaeon]|nr:ATP-binding protein [Thermoplasmata archaeon]
MYVNRDIEARFRNISENYTLVALVGPRQSGKTTFLRELSRPLNSSYVMFDDPDARGFFDHDIKKFEFQFMEGFDITVLDEVQYCSDAGPKLKYLVDSGRKMWATSSSEILLGKEVLSHLVGRVSVLRLYPFTLREFLRARGFKTVISETLERNVWEHMTYGGYPKVVTTKDPKMKAIILNDLCETMLLKDVAMTFSITDLGALEKLAKYLAATPGGIMSYGTVSKALNISFQTLKKYLDALEKSYLIVPVIPYFTNKSRELAKQPKIYYMDTGLRNSVAREFGTEPDGKIFENYVLSELVKAGLAPKYWRTKARAEVDFVVEIGGKPIPIEVKLNPDTGKVESGLRSFIYSYEPKNAYVVSYKGKKGKMMLNGCTVHFMDVLEFSEVITAD